MKARKTAIIAVKNQQIVWGTSKDSGAPVKGLEHNYRVRRTSKEFGTPVKSLEHQ